MRNLLIFTAGVFAGILANGDEALSCQTYSAAEISQAIQNSPNASQTLKNASCQFGGAGVAESGGNSCASNGANFGVLQLSSGNLKPTGYTPQQYLSMPLQQQVNIWAQQVGNSNTAGGYQTLAAANSSGNTIGGASVTPGMLAACFQFGPGICKNDIAFMQQNAGQCPTASNGGVRATRPTLANGSANLDGNNQSICSWGGAIQNKINQASAACSNKSGAPCPPSQGGVAPNGMPTSPAPSQNIMLNVG